MQRGGTRGQVKLMPNTFWHRAACVACALVVIYLTAQNLMVGTFDWLDYVCLVAVGVDVGFIVAYAIYAPRQIDVIHRRGDD